MLRFCACEDRKGKILFLEGYDLVGILLMLHVLRDLERVSMQRLRLPHSEMNLNWNEGLLQTLRERFEAFRVAFEEASNYRHLLPKNHSSKTKMAFCFLRSLEQRELSKSDAFH